MRVGFVLLFWIIVAITVSSANSQQLVYLIRHGEKEATGNDPKLTEAGKKRAAAWATMFQEAGIGTVYTSDATRTRETGTIISGMLEIQRKELPANDIAGLIEVLASAHSDENVLVVGHAETIPLMVSEFGSFSSVTISQSEFDRLFIVSPQDDDEPLLAELRMP